MMVRKAAGPVDVSDEEAVAMMGAAPAEALSIEEANLAEGLDAGALLSGMELEGGAVRTQQMLDQIKDMVESSPDIAANLVTKWAVEDD